MATITILETEYRPEEPVLDKKQVFNTFAKLRYMLRKYVKQHKMCVEMARNARHRAELAKKMARIDLINLASKVIEELDADIQYFKQAVTDIADALLSVAVQVDKVATVEEQAALLGLSTKVMKRELDTYGKNPSFSMVLTSMPESHQDMDIEAAVWMALIQSIKENPVLDRRCTQILNDTLGGPVFPVPPPIKPVAAT
jgi:uncharacterized protein (DUF305 family)